MTRLAIAAFTALLAAPASANAPPPVSPPPPPGWDVSMEEDMTLFFGTYEDQAISISCPEGLKQLRIAVAPAWEVGYGKPDGTTFNGPIDKITVTFGDKSFEAAQDPAIPTSSELSYVLKADADSVTAVMMAKNAKIALTSDPQQVREGTADTEGTFDMFATTCAQINGLR